MYKKKIFSIIALILAILMVLSSVYVVLYYAFMPDTAARLIDIANLL